MCYRPSNFAARRAATEPCMTLAIISPLNSCSLHPQLFMYQPHFSPRPVKSPAAFRENAEVERMMKHY